MKYRTIIEQDEEGNYTVQCPALAGCISEGKTGEEVLAIVTDGPSGTFAQVLYAFGARA